MSLQSICLYEKNDEKKLTNKRHEPFLFVIRNNFVSSALLLVVVVFKNAFVVLAPKFAKPNVATVCVIAVASWHIAVVGDAAFVFIYSRSK